MNPFETGPSFFDRLIDTINKFIYDVTFLIIRHHLVTYTHLTFYQGDIPKLIAEAQQQFICEYSRQEIVLAGT